MVLPTGRAGQGRTHNRWSIAGIGRRGASRPESRMTRGSRADVRPPKQTGIRWWTEGATPLQLEAFPELEQPLVPRHGDGSLCAT